MRILKCLIIAVGLTVSSGVTGLVFSHQAMATEIKYVVNGLPITSYDVAKRTAFLRLQRKSGNLAQKAADEMIDQALKASEIKRLNVNVSDKEVEAAFERFASNNKMSTAQMKEILAQTGVTAEHFKDFVRVQIGWNRVLGARHQATGPISEQDAVRRMLEQGGEKPTATEYFLQQVIFVVPEKDRSRLLAQRVREAKSLRDRFQGCEATRSFAKGLVDVTVRDLGRVLEPELPREWADAVKATGQGSATVVRETPRGAEFIGICSTREVSDDRVAQMIFSNEGQPQERAEELSEKYISELREKATIQKR